MSKKTHRRKISPRLLLAALGVFFLGSSAVWAQEAGFSIPVRLGKHGDSARVVFDLPKLTAYHAALEGGDIVLTFDTPGKIVVPSAEPPLVLGMSSAHDAAGEKVTIDVPAGATFRDYRLLKKVVVDIFSAKEKVAAAIQEKPPAPEKAEKKELPASPPPVSVAVEKQEPPASAKEEVARPVESMGPPKAAQTFTEMLALPKPEKSDQQAPVEEADAEPEPALNVQTTKISVSTIEPTRISVFTRFKNLWIVLDTAAVGAAPPDIKGPWALLLGKPRLLKFKGGAAYIYTMPDKGYIDVRKRNLTWEISVMSVPLRLPSAAQVNVEYDQTSRKAKLIAPLKDASEVLEMQDPDTGDRLYVVASGISTSRIDQGRLFPDVEILPAAAGMAVLPLKDGVKVTRIEDFALITSPDGIAATPAAGPILIVGKSEAEEAEGKLFDFPGWRQGGLSKLSENRRQLESKIASAPPEVRGELLMKLALLYFANNFGHETLGVLRLIEQENPSMPNNPNFISLRGAASALAGHYQEALADLSNPLIQQHKEVNLWIGYVAAATEQWRRAARSFPKDNRLLVEYPDSIAVPFTIYMAESALRLGRTDTANVLLDSLIGMSGEEDAHYRAAVSYLKGEALRQEGRTDEAIQLWTPVAEGLDRLYHTKASLALTNLQMQEKEITLQEAIDRIDSLRFAWRGDGLEVQILHNLGLLKIQNGQYLAGMEDMKAASGLADALLSDAEPIREDMTRIFREVFVDGASKNIAPLEAVSLYNAFSSLMPQGRDGMIAALNFADYMIQIDLLDQAATLIDQQLNSSFMPVDKLPAVGTRLAAVYLLDNQPMKAIEVLRRTGRSGVTDDVWQERELLRARAQSQLNLTDEAITTLAAVRSLNARRLKADVLWRAKRWDKAAGAIEEMLPPPSSTLTNEEAEMVVNAAVARKLAGDREGLQRLKSRYDKAMAVTPLGATFGVVTRDGDKTALADRETILRIAGEVDMFKGFLANYKAMGKGS